MRLTGFNNYLWEPDSFRCGIPNAGVPTGSVIPNVIYRAGRTPVLGLGTVSEMTIPAEFVYIGTSRTFENAWNYLLSKIAPLDPFTKTLTAKLNDGTDVTTTGYITMPAQQTAELNTLLVTFVCAPAFVAATKSTATGTF